MRPPTPLALAALALGVALGLGAARAWSVTLSGRPGRGGAIEGADRASKPGPPPTKRPVIQAPRAPAGMGPAGDAGLQDHGGLLDRVAAIVLGEVRAALAAGTATADAGAARISGHVRTLEGEPVAGVLVEAARLAEPGPPPSEEEALAIAKAQHARRGRDPREALEAEVRAAARALVRRRAAAPSAVTGPDGAYEIAGVAPGRFRVHAEKSGWEVRLRRAEGAPVPDADGAITVGADASTGGDSSTGAEARTTTVDWLAERLVPVRFDAEWPSAVEPMRLYVDVSGHGSFLHTAGEEDVRGGTISLRPGLHVARAMLTFDDPLIPGRELDLRCATAFVVGDDPKGAAVRLRFEEPPMVRVIVGGDALEEEDWDRVYVVVRPAGAFAGAEVIGRLSDGTPGLALAPGNILASGDPRRCAYLPPLPPGPYEAEARRRLDPPEAPGPRVAFTVKAAGLSEVVAPLPPAGRSVRITIAVEGLPEKAESCDFRVERRSGDRARTIAWTSVTCRGPTDAEATFTLRPADFADGDDGAASLFAVARYTTGFRAEAPVPAGAEARVALRFPAAATLALDVDPGPGAAPGQRHRAQLHSRAEGYIDGRDLEAPEGGGRLQAQLGPVAEGAYLVQVVLPGTDNSGVPVLASARIVLAPGTNRLSLALPPRSGVALRSARPGLLRVYAARGEVGVAEPALAVRELRAGVEAPLPPLPAGRYVAVLEAPPDPFAAEDAPPRRDVTAFDLPSEAQVIDLAPSSLEGWAPRLVRPWWAHVRSGLVGGDVLLAIDGAPPFDLWRPLAALLDAPPRAPDEARVTVLRGGVPLEIDLPLERIRADDARGGFAPVPGEP